MRNKQVRLRIRTKKRVGGGSTDLRHVRPGPICVMGSIEAILAGAELLDTTGTLHGDGWQPVNDHVDETHHRG